MNAAGLRAIFLAERPMLLRLLTARLGSRDEAEDALQDLWIKLETAATGPIAQPASYVFRMANNLALDRRRGATRRADRETGWHDVQPGPLEQPGPERELAARERLARLDAALNALPDRVATTFRLYRFEEMSRQAVAERTGISVSAVEKLLQRAYRLIGQGSEDPAVGIAGPRRLDHMGHRNDV